MINLGIIIEKGLVRFTKNCGKKELPNKDGRKLIRLLYYFDFKFDGETLIDVCQNEVIQREKI